MKKNTSSSKKQVVHKSIWCFCPLNNYGLESTQGLPFLWREMSLNAEKADMASRDIVTV